MGLLRAITSSFTEKVLRCTDDAELITRSITKNEIEHASVDGCAYVWNSLNTDIDVGDTRLFLKNTSDKVLSLTRMVASPSNVVCRWAISIGAATTTPSGTLVTAINMNERFSTTTFDYLAYDDETAVATATEMFAVVTSTVESKEVDLTGIILGKNMYIQVNQLTTSTSGQVSIFGHIDNT